MCKNMLVMASVALISFSSPALTATIGSSLCPNLNLDLLPKVICSTKDAPLSIPGSKNTSNIIYNVVRDPKCVGSVGLTTITKGLQSLFKGSKEYHADESKSRVIKRPTAECRYLYPADWKTPALWGKALAQYPLGFVIESDITEAITQNVPPKELCPSISIQEFASLVNSRSFKEVKPSKAKFEWTIVDKAYFPEKVDISKLPASMSRITNGFYGHKEKLEVSCVYTYKPGGVPTDVNTIYEVLYNPFK